MKKQLLLLAPFMALLVACQRGIPEVWPATYAEYQAMSEQQKAEIKANCDKHGDFMKGIPLPSCFLSRPLLVRNAAEAEVLYAKRLAEWEAYKNAQ